MRLRVPDLRAASLLMACLLGLGFWQLGQGAWIPTKAWVAQEMMQRAWRRAEEGEAAPPPWPWADTWPVARLVAKGGDVELIVLEGGSGRTLAFGPGHLSASVLPGESGNSIIVGHRDTHFRFLKDVGLGDTVLIERPDGRGHLFRIVGVDVVDARRGSILLDTEEPMLSLVTCYPFDAAVPGGPMRYVVTAAMIY
jgi:sortase A